jgi:hypothetical protein
LPESRGWNIMGPAVVAQFHHSDVVMYICLRCAKIHSPTSVPVDNYGWLSQDLFWDLYSSQVQQKEQSESNPFIPSAALMNEKMGPCRIVIRRNKPSRRGEGERKQSNGQPP